MSKALKKQRRAKLTSQEIETLLCALRAWQTRIEEGTAIPHMNLNHPEMTAKEIDDFCERLNFGDYNA